MPRPADQAAIVPPEDGPFAIVRLLLRPGTWYEDQRDRFKPFDRIVEPDEAHARRRRGRDPARPDARPPRLRPGQQQGGRARRR